MFNGLFAKYSHLENKIMHFIYWIRIPDLIDQQSSYFLPKLLGCDAARQWNKAVSLDALSNILRYTILDLHQKPFPG